MCVCSVALWLTLGKGSTLLPVTQLVMELDKDPDGALAFFSFTCSDGQVVIAADELREFCAAGNVIGGLIHGQQGGIGTAHTPQVEIFSAWPSGVLNLLRACVRNRRVPSDARAIRFIKSGELREFADAFGGFAIVDEVLAAEERRKEEGCQAKTPSEDTAGLFEWRVVGPVPAESRETVYNGQKHVVCFSDQGYQMAGTVTDDNRNVFYHMRKRRRVE